MKTLNSKGQVFSTDVIVALVVFLFILVLAIVYPTQVANRVDLMEKDNARNLSAQNTANSLLYSAGSPANWENLGGLDGVSGIGLADGGMNEISLAKMQRLADLNAGNYGRVRDLLGVGRYGLKVLVLELGGKSILAEFGLEPGEGSKISAVNRIGLYNGEEVLVRVKVFE